MAFPLRHILFPTDFSKNAEHALFFAAEIAYRNDAALTLYHASQDTMDFAPSFEHSKDETIHDANEHFDQLVKKLKQRKKYRDIEISTMLQSGQPIKSLLDHIKEEKPDLVVMGTKGATSNRNAVFGSVTTNLIQKSEAPVLAIPHGSSLDKFKNVVFTTDYKEGDIAALEQTIGFAEFFNSNVDVLHVADKKDLENDIKFRGFRDLITNRVSYEKLNFHLIYEHDFFPGIADYLLEKPTSLLVMVRYKKTFWEKLAERDHSKEMAFYSNVPLLMLVGKEQVERNIKTKDAREEQNVNN